MLKRVYYGHEKEYHQRQRHSWRVQSGHDQQTAPHPVQRVGQGGGESENQKTKRPRGQKGKKGKRTRVAEMAGLQREEQLGGGEVQTVRGGGRVCPPEGSC